MANSTITPTVTVQSIEKAAQFPISTAELFSLFGGTVVILGVLMFSMSGPRTPNKAQGKWFIKVGILFLLIGYNYSGFIKLVNYVIP